MPSFTVHLAVPLLFLLALRRFDARKVWILWPLTLASDLDYFIPGFHRAATTNLFVLMPFLVGLVVAARSRPFDRGLAEWMVIALVYLLSHFVMDTFQGGIVPLYPLSDYTVCYYGGVDVITATNTLQPYFEACSHEGIPTVVERYPWVSSVDMAMLAFLVPSALVASAMNLRSYVRARAGPAATK
jgi:hypothetical protein